MEVRNKKEKVYNITKKFYEFKGSLLSIKEKIFHNGPRYGNPYFELLCIKNLDDFKKPDLINLKLFPEVFNEKSEELRKIYTKDKLKKMLGKKFIFKYTVKGNYIIEFEKFE